MTNVAVIGTGFVGRAWAITFARAGHRVSLWDADGDAPQRAVDFIGTVLPDLEANDLLNGRAPADVLADIAIVDDLGGALDGAAYVQECTPEDVEMKKAVFSKLDALAGRETILASSTSAILPSLFTEEWWFIRSIPPTSSLLPRSCRHRGQRPRWWIVPAIFSSPAARRRLS